VEKKGSWKKYMNVDGEAESIAGMSPLREGVLTEPVERTIGTQPNRSAAGHRVPWTLAGLLAGFGLLTVGNGLFQTLIPLHMVLSLAR
jgi:hypothetical protein